MSQSKSSKTDKEEMWDKLSTPYERFSDMDRWHERFMAGLKKGQLNTIAVGKGTGKSVYMDIESNP